MSKETSIILSLYPNGKGLGYVCMEKPQKLIDSGLMTTRPFSGDKVLSRISKFVDFYRPSVIIIKDYDSPTSRRASRIISLMDTIVAQAEAKNMPVYRYTRLQIRDVFEQFGAITKHEIAQKIITWFPELADKAPKIRKPWMDEDYHMGVFDAISLAMTHQYITE